MQTIAFDSHTETDKQQTTQHFYFFVFPIAVEFITL